MKREITPGDVVYAAARYGSQTKVRPAIVVEIQADRLYLLLGSTKNLVNDPTTVVVSDSQEMETMGLKYHTQFHWGAGGDQWVTLTNVERIIGKAPASVVAKVGQAWADAKFARLL
jgi:hypothetical protein